jgi:single-stranded DNA-binding protein
MAAKRKSDYNKVTLHGRLVYDPKLITTRNGTAMCSFTMASDDYFGDTKNTLFVKCVAFNELASTIYQSKRKGDSIRIDSAKLSPSRYTKKDGTQVDTFQLTVFALQDDRDGVSRPRKPEADVMDDASPDIPF